jgi:hypothetical protein
VHRRIQIFGYVSLSLSILLVPIFFAWLGFRLISCSSDVSQEVCEWGIAAPLVPTLLITGCLTLALVTLIGDARTLDKDIRVEKLSWANPSRATHYVRRGYRRLRPSHKKHLRRTFSMFSFALACFVSFWAFYWGLPALASMLIGVVIVVSVAVFNWWARPASAAAPSIDLDLSNM